MRTQRLRLRPVEEHDVDAVWAVHSDPRTYEHRPDLVMTSRAEADALCEAWRLHWEKDGVGYCLVTDHDDQPLGFCGVRFVELGSEAVLNLYYRFAPSAQGRGFAFEAAQAVLEWARDRHPSVPIVAMIDPKNEPSARLALKLGFRLGGACGDGGGHVEYRLNKIARSSARSMDPHL
ncbi:GNAT family N-acetyltransferase [Falsarthrobacter nasiphocae]|uniref:GNAT family N-acetyltransferase n=1 Tax=Falsarthrobacter nasiphocae TaxID=189863 RepID=UPI00286B546E|nr:GNAT family N-acetyltransferase [Falsarthrobacter nasiphocae]